MVRWGACVAAVVAWGPALGLAWTGHDVAGWAWLVGVLGLAGAAAWVGRRGGALDGAVVGAVGWAFGAAPVLAVWSQATVTEAAMEGRLQADLVPTLSSAMGRTLGVLLPSALGVVAAAAAVAWLASGRPGLTVSKGTRGVAAVSLPIQVALLGGVASVVDVELTLKPVIGAAVALLAVSAWAAASLFVLLLGMRWVWAAVWTMATLLALVVMAELLTLPPAWLAAPAVLLAAAGVVAPRLAVRDGGATRWIPWALVTTFSGYAIGVSGMAIAVGSVGPLGDGNVAPASSLVGWVLGASAGWLAQALVLGGIAWAVAAGWRRWRPASG